MRKLKSAISTFPQSVLTKLRNHFSVKMYGNLSAKLARFQHRPLTGFPLWFEELSPQFPPSLEIAKAGLLNSNALPFAQGENFQLDWAIFIKEFATNAYLSFIFILEEDEERANQRMELAEQNLTAARAQVPPNGIISKHEGHYDGAKELLDSLRLLHSIQFGQGVRDNEEDSRAQGGGSRNHCEAIQLILKARFIGEVVGYTMTELELQLVDQALQIDDDWEWHLIKSQVLKFQSFTSRYRNSGRQRNACFFEAFRKNPNHPAITAGLMELLSREYNAENIMEFTHTRTLSGAVNWTKEVARDLLETSPYPDWLNYFCILFTRAKHSRFHDWHLAKSILERAIVVSPSCSKSHHRLGKILVEHESDYDLGFKHLTYAVNLDRRNKSATVDLFKLISSFRVVNRLEAAERANELLDAAFFQQWTEENVPPAVISIRFLRGYINYQAGNVEMAFQDWVVWARLFDAYSRTRSLPVISFQNLERLANWGWRRESYGFTFLRRVRADMERLLDVNDQNLLRGMLPRSILQ